MTKNLLYFENKSDPFNLNENGEISNPGTAETLNSQNLFQSTLPD